MPDYSRYGLKANPYRSRELDPLAAADDDKKLVDVDGFGAARERVGKALEAAVKARRPAFFLVAGGSGTGRSSVANWILAQYADLRGLPRSRLLVPERKVSSRDDFNTLLNWFGYLDNRIAEEDDIDLGDATATALVNLGTVAKRDTMIPPFRGIAKRISRALESQKNAAGEPNPAGYAVCFEKVEEYSIIRSTLDVFEKINTIGVFTTYGQENVGKEVVELFPQDEGSLHHILSLGPLTAPEVATLLRDRWIAACEVKNRLPFEVTALEQALGQPPRPLGRVLVLMSKVIDTKLAGGGGCWPQDANLELTAQQLMDLIRILESQ